MGPLISKGRLGLGRGRGDISACITIIHCVESEAYKHVCMSGRHLKAENWIPEEKKDSFGNQPLRENR